MPPPRPAGLTAARAAALGALHGPAELLPVSSSAHVALIARLARWGWEELDPATRKAFEVALHAGTLAGGARLLGRPRGWLAAVSVAPPALAGLALERAVERRLGGVRATAAGLVAGSAVLVAAARLPGDRPAADAGPADALALGAGQALALVPGLSRMGMAWAAARVRGFTPAASASLAREAAVPVLTAAAGLKAWRLARGGLDPALRGPFAAGAAAAAVSALAAAPYVGRWPPVGVLAAERCLLAATAVRRL